MHARGFQEDYSRKCLNLVKYKVLYGVGTLQYSLGVKPPFSAATEL